MLTTESGRDEDVTMITTDYVHYYSRRTARVSDYFPEAEERTDLKKDYQEGHLLGQAVRRVWRRVLRRLHARLLVGVQKKRTKIANFRHMRIGG